MATIIFNGKTYNGPEEMSAADRAAFEQLSGIFVDKNGNGIPDFLEGDIIKNVSTAYTNIVNINGKMFNDMSEMPEDMKVKVQDAFKKMAELGIVTTSSSSNMDQANNIQGIQEPQFISRPYVPQGSPSAIQEGNRPSTLQWVLVGLLVAFCLMTTVAGAVYFYLK